MYFSREWVHIRLELRFFRSGGLAGLGGLPVPVSSVFELSRGQYSVEGEVSLEDEVDSALVLVEGENAVGLSSADPFV